MAEIRRRLSLVGWLFIINFGISAYPEVVGSPIQQIPAQEQKIAGFFKTAPSLWQNYQQETPLRQRLALHGRWRVSCQEPELAGEIELPAAFSFEGQIVLQRSFRLDSAFINQPLRLVIQGANYETKVEINEDFAGSHEGGHSPFAIELRPERLFFDKENLITLTVSNELSPLQTLPAKQRPYGWLNEGGVLREIYLETLPEISIENTKIKYNFDQPAVALNLSAELRLQKKMTAQEAAAFVAVIEIWEADRVRKLAASALTPLAENDRLRQILALSCQVNQPALWSPAAPNLYAMRFALLRQNEVVDECWQNIGFRKIEIADQQFWLNGEPFVVRGVDLIENYANNSALLDTAQALKLLMAAKELGANAIRVVGHLPHPFLPALCDRLGIFLLEELPIYYFTEDHFRQPQFAELALLQAREMILRDRNHPSVLSWGVGVNSALFSPDIKTIFSSLCREIRQLDVRPIYAVAPLAWLSDWVPQVDFLLPDLFEQGGIAAFANTAASSPKPLMPIVGFWRRDERVAPEPVAGAAAPSSDAEKRQAEKLDDLLEKLEEMPKFAGYFLHALADWPASMPVLIVGPNLEQIATNQVGAGLDQSRKFRKRAIFYHPAGLIGKDGRRRMAFQVVQAFNRSHRRPLLSAKTLEPVYPQAYPIVGISVILLTLFYLNRDRRLRANLQRIFVHPHGFYIDVYENRKVPPFLSTLLGIMESCIVASLLSGFCYAYRENVIFDQFLNLLITDPVWKARAIWLIWHPGWFIAIGTAGLFALGTVVAVFLRILGFFLGRGLPTVQYYTFVFWTSANLLLLGIIAPFFHRLLLYSDFAAPIIFLISITFLWLAGRFFRGMRVIYTMSILRTAIIFGILAGGLIVSLVLYYQRNEAIFEYAKYYWQMLNVGDEN
ncbi:MAG: glycoside hydrolase family 2 TIM barrel-domain containing protein [bacterium]